MIWGNILRRFSAAKIRKIPYDLEEIYGVTAHDKKYI